MTTKFTRGTIWKNISTGNIVQLTSEPNLYDNCEAVDYRAKLRDPHGYFETTFTVSIFELEAMPAPKRVYVSQADTNKLIRADLKAAFPNVKFSVKIVGGSTRITYTGDLIRSDVEKVIAKYESSSFDGMTDLALGMSNYDVDTNTEYTYGTKYINVSRNYDLDTELLWAKFYQAKFQFKDRQGNVGVPAIEVVTKYHNGKDCEPYVSYPDHSLTCGSQRIQDLVWYAFGTFRTYEDMLAHYGYTIEDMQ